MAYLFWVFISLLFFLFGRSLLLSVIILEIISFLLLYLVSSAGVLQNFSSYFLIILFCLFVIDGVIALSGLISLVSFTGSDFVSTYGLVQ